MKIQLVVRDKSGCEYHRIILPFSYMGKDPSWSSKHSIEMLFIAQDEHFIDCDILVYNKCIATPVEVLKQLQAQGMKIVVDIDDYWILPPGNPYAPQWNGSGNDKLTEEHIKIANLVICTSMRLQEKVRELNKNTVVIPNALPFGDGQFAPGEKIVTDKMSFLYAGGVGHLADVKLLEGKFKCVGYQIDYSFKYIAVYQKIEN